MPGPNGPSRMMVWGTTFQPTPPTPGTRRPHGPRACRRGSPTAAPPRDRLVHAVRHVVLEVRFAQEGGVARERIRPMTVRSPSTQHLAAVAALVRFRRHRRRTPSGHRAGSRWCARRCGRPDRAARRTAGTAAVRRRRPARRGRELAGRPGVRNTRRASGPSSVSSSTTDSSTSSSVTASSSTTTAAPRRPSPDPSCRPGTPPRPGWPAGSGLDVARCPAGSAVPNRRVISSSSAAMRSASTATCCFSSSTEITRFVVTACR